MTDSAKRSWVIFALATVFLWGIWGALAGLSAQRGFPDTLVYCVWSLTMIPPALFVLARNGWKLDRSPGAIGYGMTVGLLGAGGQMLLFKALTIGPAYFIFPIISLSPAITIAMSFLLLRERTGKLGALGIVLALVALPLFDLSLGQGNSQGLGWFALALLIMAAWGVQAYFMKLANNTVSAESIFFYMMVGGLVLAPVAWFMTDFSQPVNLGWDGPAMTAGIQILSNDADESAFAIALEGSGLGIPILTVSLADDVPLVDQAKAIGFGSQVVGRSGKTRIFTVRNGGSSELNGLAVALQGKSKDFIVGPLGAVTLAPGASTDFSVTFRPQALQLRLAALELTSNDSATGRFDIKLSGKGVPKSSNSAASHATAATGRAARGGALSLPSTSVDIVDGQKFLTLTATKPPGISGITATIEVSSNLIDWLSGDQHTTVVMDNDATLKIRDNTPISPGAKRYIRLR